MLYLSLTVGFSAMGLAPEFASPAKIATYAADLAMIAAGESARGLEVTLYVVKALLLVGSAAAAAGGGVYLRKKALERRGTKAQTLPVPNASPHSSLPRFIAHHPGQLKIGTSYQFLVYAYISDAIEQVQKDFREYLGAKTGSYQAAEGKAATAVASGAEITIVPRVPGCVFDPERASFLWTKDWHRIKFSVETVPHERHNVPGAELIGEVSVYNGPIVIAELRISVRLAERDMPAAKEGTARQAKSTSFRAIFVSYSRRDKTIAEVLEKFYESTGDKVLRDVNFLRSGEPWEPAILEKIAEADLFQLCWSNAARESKNVEKEWRQALEIEHSRPHPNFLRPIYWDEPMTPAPPELEDKHFYHYHPP